MALEAVVYPNHLFNYSCKELYSSLNGEWSSFGFDVKEEEENGSCTDGRGRGRRSEQEEEGGSGGGGGFMVFENQNQINNNNNNLLYSSSSSAAQNLKKLTNSNTNSSPITESKLGTTTSRRKRRRTKSSKNKEEVENQRMTHIFVERNRRKQMNEYLSILRSLMPPSYVQRSDQASIVGGAINFLKELEQLLQTLEAQKRLKQQRDRSSTTGFTNFFTFPAQFSSSCSTHCSNSAALNESVGETGRSGSIANIEITKMESHANLKILSRRRPKQLLKMVIEFQKLKFTILHLSVTTVDQMVLYSFSIKVEEECQLTSVDEISMAVNQMLDRINEEASSSSSSD